MRDALDIGCGNLPIAKKFCPVRISNQICSSYIKNRLDHGVVVKVIVLRVENQSNSDSRMEIPCVSEQVISTRRFGVTARHETFQWLSTRVCTTMVANETSFEAR